ncbi:hypothetical protein ULMA_09610 [Patiriisocius marinus]|uniref:Uncharacterized protein n=1 Tax=Patiriisocius marinus TaxID=1397112 RepID=A0A5J4IZD9_9FLAO|nr:hypothetical protein ULMA_09610 [Patiriisocius marinus]
MGKLRCKIKGHNLTTVSTANVLIKKYECSHCKQQYTVNGYGKIVKMDSVWEKNHQLFINYFERNAAV